MFKFIFILIQLNIFSLIYSQLPYTFTQTARNSHYGYAEGVAVGSDGTIFLATNGPEGMFAYTYSGYSEIQDDYQSPMPSKYYLSQNYPNPFNPYTMINYQLPEKSTVEIVIYNLLGQKVVDLFKGNKQAGSHIIEWDASNNPSGMYFIKMQTRDFIDMKKCLLLK